MEGNLHRDNNHLGESMKDFPKYDIKKEPDHADDEYISESDSIITKSNWTGLIICKSEIEDQRVNSEIKDYECDIKLKRELINDDSEVHPEFIKTEELILKEVRKACDFCTEDGINYCSKYSNLAVINNKPIPLGVPDRTIQTIPEYILVIQTTSIDTSGIFAQVCLSTGVLLGPYEGLVTKVKDENGGYSWKLLGGRLEDISDATGSNYLRYINIATDVSEQNLEPFQYKGELYYRTCRNINRGEELLVYFEDYPADNYFKPHEESSIQSFETCEYCNIGMLLKEHRDEHQKICMLREDEKDFSKSLKILKIYTCDCCSYKANSKILLKQHKSIEHQRTTLNKCIDRDYEAYYENFVTQHRQKNEQKIIIKCPDCDYETYYRSSINRHRQTHVMKNVFKCDDCDYNTYSKRNFMSHVIKHENKKAFKCQYCKYETNNKTHMTHHKQKHERKNVFKCLECEYETFSKDYIKRHKQKHKHYVRNVFKCTQCSFVSCYKGNLTKHRRIHDKKVYSSVKSEKMIENE